MTARVELTTSPGLEDLVLDELRSLGVADLRGVICPEGRAGHVHAEASGGLWAAVQMLRSVHRVVRPVARLELPGDGALAFLRSELARLAPSVPELTTGEPTFRVSCKRTGTHPFTSEDVARVAGAGIRDALPRAVRLRGFDVHVRCDVAERVARVGVQRVGVALSSRAPGPFRPKTSLRANVAWALLQLARPDGVARRVIDPFAGAGTVLVEAGARWPEARLAGSDLHERCVAGLRENLAFQGLEAEVRQGDARRLAEVWPEGDFDTIATNPPFGKRMGAGVDLEALYRRFLAGAAAVATSDARMAVLVGRRGAFNRALRAAGAWETRHVRIVEVGGLYPGVFVLGRR